MNHPAAFHKVRPQSLMEKIVSWTAIYTAFYSIFAGAAHFLLDKAHLGLINNIPGILGYALFMVYFVHALFVRKANMFMIYLALFILFYMTYAFGMELSLIQVMMGFYIWGYFLIGVLVVVYETEQNLFACLPVLWLIAVLGILLNYFITYPWVGGTYEIAGTTMQMARDWAAEGIARLAGFSRMSASAAAQILLGCLYIMVSRRYSLFIKTAVYILSLVSVALTTSKTELGLLLMYPFFLGTYRMLHVFWHKSPAAFIFARAVMVIWVGLIVLLPFTLSTHAQARMTGPLYGFITMDTFLDRTTRMWPEAFDLLDFRGNRWFGRGVGGIGTGLSMQDPLPDTVNAADNMFIYVFVECGAFGAIPFMLGFILNLGRLYRQNERYFETIWAIAFGILGVGLMEGNMEDSFSALFMGIIMARGYVAPRHLEDFTAADAPRRAEAAAG